MEIKFHLEHSLLFQFFRWLVSFPGSQETVQDKSHFKSWVQHNKSVNSDVLDV